jgi:cytochrome c-type biogenesis protein CcmH
VIQPLFWTLLALMTLAAVGAIAWPLVTARGGTGSRADYDRRVYRDQLRELENDVVRGVISPSEADAARTEIERRLLATADEEAPAGRGERRADAPGRRPIAAAAVVVLMPVLGLSFYMWLGWPAAPGADFAGRAHPPLAPGAGAGAGGMAAGQATPHDLDANIQRLKARLDADPADIQGWLLLGRSYAFTGRHHDASAAYKRALALAPDDDDVQILVAEALVMAAGGKVAAESEKMFRAVLERDAAHPGARYYLALAKAQAGQHREAFDMWRSLLLDSPPDAPWRGQVAERVREMGERLGLAAGAGVPADAMGAGMTAPRQPPAGAPARTPPAAAGGAGPRGPSAADIAAAQQMAPEDRQQMIRSMVEGLAARLDENPNDPEGWQRLARAYGVLGEKEKALRALGKIAELRPDDVATLLNYASAIIEARSPGQPFPERAIVVFNRILTIAPDNPGALYYLGLADAEAGRVASARARWQQLLPRLEPNSPSYQTVKRALDSLGN